MEIDENEDNEAEENIRDIDNLDPENEHSEIVTLDIDSNDTSISNSLPHKLRCASHTLSLVATVDLLGIMKSSDVVYNDYNRVISRCQALWSSSRSPKKSELLRKLFNQALRRPVVTRWNSLYDSLKQIFNLKEKILKNTSDLKKIGVNNILNDTGFR